MIRLLCLLGFISLFVGCPAKGGSDDASTASQTEQSAAANTVAEKT